MLGSRLRPRKPKKFCLEVQAKILMRNLVPLQCLDDELEEPGDLGQRTMLIIPHPAYFFLLSGRQGKGPAADPAKPLCGLQAFPSELG